MPVIYFLHMGKTKSNKQRPFSMVLIRTYALVAIVPPLLLCVLLVHQQVRRSLEESRAHLEIITNGAADSLKDRIETMNFLSANLIAQPQFLTNSRNLTLLDKTPGELQSSYIELLAALRSYIFSSTQYRIVWFNENGLVIDNNLSSTESSYVHSTHSKEEITNWKYLRTIEESKGGIVLLPVRQGDFLWNGTDTFAVVRSIRLPMTTVGYMAVICLVPDFPLSFAGGLTNLTYRTTLDDESVLSQSPLFPTNLDHKVIFQHEYLEKYGVNLVLALPRESINNEVGPIIFSWLLFSLILVFILLATIILFSQKVARPLVQLDKRIGSLTLDTLKTPDTPIEGTYQEVASLDESFRNMQERLDEMMRQQIKFHQMQAEEQLRTLQAQINPHFIYNTLNVISIMGIEGRGREVSDACQKLSSIFRYSSGNADGLSPLIEELSSVEAFLQLMKLRYGDHVEFTVTHDKQLEQNLMPRLTIQPFVENIFEHAFDLTHRNVHINIACQREPYGWRIVIENDGKPFEQARIDEIKQQFAGPIDTGSSHFGGMGIVNTLLRLRLTLKDQFEWEINQPCRITLQFNEDYHV